MADLCQDALRCNPNDLRQAMSIHTRKITDSCRDKDCIEDLPVYLTAGSQRILESSANTRVRCAELMNTYIDVEPVAFDKTHYCIDITFYYRILADTIVGANRPAALCGIAVFTKRVVLCGEESCAHIYRSDRRDCTAEAIGRNLSNRPSAVVEALDPMVLSSRVREACECGGRDGCTVQLPDWVRASFDEDFAMQSDRRRLYVTLGQFSIVRLERDAQLIVPVMDYSIPTKECCDSPGCAEDPCEMFSRIPFPAAQFTPRGCDCKPKVPDCGCCGK